MAARQSQQRRARPAGRGAQPPQAAEPETHTPAGPFERFVSPRGTLTFTALQTPRAYKEKGKADGKPKYSATMTFSGMAAVEFAQKIDRWMDEAADEFPGTVMAPPPYRNGEDDDGNPNGEISVKFSVNAEATRRDGSTWDRRPRLFDSQGKHVELDGISIGNGTVGRMEFMVYKRKQFGSQVGITLQPTAFQILELQEYGGSSPFKPDEGGSFVGDRSRFNDAPPSDDADDADPTSRDDIPF